MTSTNMNRAMLVQLVVSILLVVLALNIVLQNTSSIATRVPFTTVTMPGAFLLLCTLAIGLIGCIAAAMAVIRRRTSSK